MSDDDADLMRCVARGETDAFRLLVERYRREMYNFFLRSAGGAEDAEDLTQQLFMNLYRSASRYRRTASFRTFIYRIASNLAVSFARKRRLRTALSLERIAEEGFEPPADSTLSDPSVDAERAELQHAYGIALARLPADWRTAIELRVGRGFSYREIADIMGKSVASVESLIFRARERLARDLARFR